MKKPDTSKKRLAIPCEIYSRIVGYMRPVRDWNKGKVQEWRERKVYNKWGNHVTR